MFTRRDFLKTTAATSAIVGTHPAWQCRRSRKGPRSSSATSARRPGRWRPSARADKFVIDSFLATTKGMGLNYEVVVKDSQSNPNRALKSPRN